FHMSLFIGGWRFWGIPYGYWLVGLSGIALAVSFVSSLIFYRRFWRGFFKLETRKGAKVLWSDIHKLTGLWSLWFIALIAATGIWYLVEWKVTSEAPLPDPPVASGEAGPMLPISELVMKAERAYPALEIRSVVLDGMSAGLFEVQGQDGALLTRDRGARVWLDARDGSTIAIRRAAELRPLHRWIDMADPLHFGNFGGLVSKTIWFLFGVGLSGLCLTGAYLQAKRQRRSNPASRRAPITAAYFVTGFTLLASVWFGHQEMLRYGTDGRLPEIPWTAIAIVGVWLLSTIAALSIWMRALR
ncbi:MAG: PepSY-associated TM helix domain-containing protein, partial [Parvularculaceae bacterium]